MSDASARKAAFRRSVTRRFKEIDQELRGKYKKELDGLLGISREEIDAITPGRTTDIETYAKLIAVVKEASRRNIAQAELKARIQELGEIALKIAAKVPPLAAKVL